MVLLTLSQMTMMISQIPLRLDCLVTKWLTADMLKSIG